MRIQYTNASDQLLFEQFLILPPSMPMFLGPTESTMTHIQILTEIGYKSIRATLRDPNIPGGTYIIDEKGNPLIAIASDGNIYTLDQKISIQPMSQNGPLRMELSDGMKLIGQVIYQTDFYYTLK